MTDGVWDEARLQQLINDQIEESSNLEYKEARALDKKSQDKKAEITKDVSALANSAGGTLIYGISEAGKSHVPKAISPIDRIQYSKEWLEQIINGIQPRIDGIVIHPVTLSSGMDDVAYVVEVPKSTTAHQAKDKLYYKRYNFECRAMEDYDIRDVMNRNQHPKIELEFSIVIETDDRNGGIYGNLGRGVPDYVDTFELRVKAYNIGNVYAKYVHAFITIPSKFARKQQNRELGSDGPLELQITRYEQDIPLFEFSRRNQISEMARDSIVNLMYQPILPNLSMLLRSEYLDSDFEKHNIDDFIVKWETLVDNAPQNHGEVVGKDIRIIDNREPKDEQN